MLHILSPAGLVLAAPYSEALFSLLSFLGYYLYAVSAHAYHARNGALAQLLLLLAVFLLVATVRGNGVLNGLVLLSEFLSEAYAAAVGGGTGVDSGVRGVGERVGRLLGLGIAGVMVGLGVAMPQVLAWLEYCTIEGETREWCSRTIPLCAGSLLV